MDITKKVFYTGLVLTGVACTLILLFFLFVGGNQGGEFVVRLVVGVLAVLVAVGPIAVIAFFGAVLCWLCLVPIIKIIFP